MADGTQRDRLCPLWRAVLLLAERRWLSPPTVRMALLRRMATLGLAYQCGRLFHVSPACDRIAEQLRQPSPQPDLFSGAA